MIESRENETSFFFESRAVLSSWVWCRREFKVLILSLKKAKIGPRVGTQATMIDTFSSTLSGRSVLIEARGERRQTRRVSCY